MTIYSTAIPLLQGWVRCVKERTEMIEYSKNCIQDKGIGENQSESSTKYIIECINSIPLDRRESTPVGMSAKAFTMNQEAISIRRW